MGCGGSSSAKDDDDPSGKGNKNNKVKPEQGNKGKGQNQQRQQQNQQQQRPAKKRRKREHRDPVRESGYKRRIRQNLQLATNGNNLSELQNCINAFEKNKLEDNGDLSDAYDKLEFLKLKKEIHDAIQRRHAGTLDKAIYNVENSEYAGNLQHSLEEARALRDHLHELDRYKHDILEMDQNTISEIHSYQHPPDGTYEVMKGTYMILGHNECDLEEWTDIKRMLGWSGKSGLLREVRAADTINLDDETCKRVTKLQENYSQEQICVVSYGVATFYEWNQKMCQKYAKDKQQEEDRNQQDQQRQQQEQQRQQQEQQNVKQQSGKGKQNRKQNKG